MLDVELACLTGAVSIKLEKCNIREKTSYEVNRTASRPQLGDLGKGKTPVGKKTFWSDKNNV